MTGDETRKKTENDELQRQQPGGGIHPKVLVAIGAVLILAAIVILIVVLNKT